MIASSVEPGVLGNLCSLRASKALARLESGGHGVPSGNLTVTVVVTVDEAFEMVNELLFVRHERRAQFCCAEFKLHDLHTTAGDVDGAQTHNCKEPQALGDLHRRLTGQSALLAESLLPRCKPSKLS